MDLDDFTPLKEAITAQKMKEIAGHGFNFRKTLSAISEDSSKKIIEYIEENKLSNL